MRMIFSLSILFSAAVAFADVKPENMCDGVSCTPSMHEVVRDYIANPQAPEFTQAAWIASGECWHIQPRFDPTVTHHGVFLFENTSSGPLARGMFHFFAKKDPYAELSETEIRRQLGVSGGEGTPVQIFPDHLYWDHARASTQLTYFIRANSVTGETFLISRWAFGGVGATDIRIFCRMRRH